MEQWSILSSVVNYIQYDRYLRNFHSLTVSAVNKEKHKRNSNIKGERCLRIRFWRHTREIKKGISRHVQRYII